MAVRPGLSEEFAKGSVSDIRRAQAVEDLRSMFRNEKKLPNTPVSSTLKEMLNVYDTFVQTASQISDRSAASLARLDNLKAGTKQQLMALSESNPNTKSAYTMLFAQLIGD